MSSVRIRHVAQINPQTPAFNGLSEEDSVTFLPMESIWPDSRLDLSVSRRKKSVEVGYTRFQNGDILLPKITPTFEADRTLLIDGLRSGVGAGTTEVHVVRPAPFVDPRFLTYALKTDSFLKLGHAAMYGVAGQKRVPDAFVRDWMVSLPPLDEQRRIADFLDEETSRIDRLMEISSRQMALIDEYLLETMRRFTSVGEGQGRKTGIPWMPTVSEECRLPKVAHVFRTGSGTTPKTDTGEYFNGPYPWVNSGDVKNCVVTRTVKSVTYRALLDYSTLRLYPRGTVVIALYGQGSTKGNVGVLDIEACVNQACCALIPIEGISSHFSYYWFKAHKDGLVSLALGAGQPNLSQEMVRNLRIPFPSEKTQQRLVSMLFKEELIEGEKKKLLASRIELLAERKRALITAAVTGEFDVSTASGRGTV
jgi:type I restriction enzyme, S subunit